MSRRDEVRELVSDLCYGPSTPKLEAGIDEWTDKFMRIFGKEYYGPVMRGGKLTDEFKEWDNDRRLEALPIPTDEAEAIAKGIDQSIEDAVILTDNAGSQE